MSINHTVLYQIPSQTPAANAMVATELSDGFRNAVFAIYPAGTVAFTLKFVKSNQDTLPDFTATATGTNQWEYEQVIDLNDGSAITGATGVTFGATTARSFEWNNNTSKWIGVICSAYTSGTLAGNIFLSLNQ